MTERFTWKGELVFKGSVDEFNKLAELLDLQPVRVGIAEWAKIERSHLAGCNRVPVDKLLERAKLDKIIVNQPRIKLKFIKDIRGGIRSPHMHLADEVVLLNRNRFKTLVKEVATVLAETRVDRLDDYINVMGTVNRLADDPVPI
jgi:hypothetical protein